MRILNGGVNRGDKWRHEGRLTREKTVEKRTAAERKRTNSASLKTQLASVVLATHLVDISEWICSQKVPKCPEIDMASSSSFFILITLFSLALVASITEARVVPGEYNNWQAVAKDEVLVEAIDHLIHGAPSTTLSSKKSDCHTSSDNNDQKEGFVRDFEPRPNVSAYPDDAKLKGERTTFMKDFEPRPHATAYPDEDDAGLRAEKEFVKDFEPRPNVSVYQG